MIQQLLWAFIIVVFLSFIFTKIVIYIARRQQWYDKDPHHIHQNQTQVVSYGGVAIYLSFWLTTWLLMRQVFATANIFWLFMASTLVLIVGIVDDRLELNPLQKSLGIILAATVLYFQSDIEFSSALLPQVSNHIFEVLSYVMTIIWIFAVTNAINLIDGIDGLASSVSITSLVTLIITTYYFSLTIRVTFLMMLVILTGAILGFLFFNWAPAKIYLGDTGSLFIGFMFAALSVSNLKNASLFSLLVPVLIYMLPLFDASYAFLRRFLTKQPIAKADKEHLHHRLIKIGFSVTQVVYVMISITVLFSLIAIASHIWPQLRFVWLMVTGIILIALMWMMRYLKRKS